MTGNLLVINVDIREIRVALIEQGIIAELHIERLSERSSLGNICLGKVTRVLPGMQAAFIDIGQERAAFLHVEDLIRPDDFETLLKRDALEDEGDIEANGGEDGGKKKKRRRRRRKDEASADAVSEEDTDEDDSEEDADDDTDEDTDENDSEEDADEDTDEDDSEKGADDDSEEDADDDSEEDADEDAGASEQARASEQTGASEQETGGASDDDAADDVAEAKAPAGASKRVRSPRRAASAGRSRADQGDASASDDAASSAADASAADASAADASGPDDDDDDGSGDGGAGAGGTASGGSPSGGSPSGGGSAPAGSSARAARLRREFGGGLERTRSLGAAVSGDVDDDGNKEGGRRRRRRSKSKKSKGDDGGQGEGGKRSRRSKRRRSRSSSASQKDKSRISKSTPIREVVREGQEVVVQVTKEPIGTKGARVSSHISLAGRYVVYLPTVDTVGISRRIGSDKERARLRKVIEQMKPQTGGLVVRTFGEGLTKKQLKNDIAYLVRLWDEIAKTREEATQAPTLLYEELDLILKTARDLFSEDVSRIVIDNRGQYGRLKRFVEMFMPERADDVELYEGKEPVFDAYGIEDEIGRALARKVPLPSGGYLIIDQAEALTAIDVNTGRYVGKASKDLEDTILQTNLEAVEEIAYQLRFRNIGGLIILDLIDMEKQQNREKVRRRLDDLLARDKAKTTLNRISDLGLIEMTRKRTRESLGRLLHEPCFYCDGTGQLMSRETIAYEILRQIRREQADLKGWSITVNAHPAVIDLLKNEEKDAVAEVQRMFHRRIELVPRQEYHIEQFDLVGA